MRQRRFQCQHKRQRIPVSLYERHKLITYPRSDNRYLPKEHHKDAASIAAIANNEGQASEACRADTSKRSECFNDEKGQLTMLLFLPKNNFAHIIK